MTKIILKGTKKEIKIKDNESIKDACEKLGVSFGCYDGLCGTCKINIIKGKGNISEMNEKEMVFCEDSSQRLACQCKIKKGNVEIDF